MYFVKLIKTDNSQEVQGTLAGQGFYPYKKVNTVVRKLYERMRHLPSQYKVGYQYQIYQGTTSPSEGQLVLTLPIKEV